MKLMCVINNVLMKWRNSNINDDNNEMIMIIIWNGVMA